MSQQDLSPRECFRFESQAVTGDHALHVVRFSGEEGLNMLYSFEIVLATQEKDLPIEDMLAQPARLTLLREDDNNACFSGLPTRIEMTSRYKEWTFYNLTLQPAFWHFTQIVQNSIHINKDVSETVKNLLESIDYFDVSHEFRLSGNYPKQEFSMQHNESIYDYIAWKLEREGIYYYFDEKDDGEHVVFADNPQAHTVLEHTPELTYSPTSGLEYFHREEVLARFSLQVSRLPRQVVLRDYNWMKPQTPVVVSAPVANSGLGNVYYYGEGFTTREEGERLAKIRAAALACTGRVFTGESSVSTIRPGFVFNLKGHFDEKFNRDYTITTVKHEGSQEAWLSLAIGVPIVRDNDKLFYRNTFTCIPADVQYRPQRKTTRAKVSGMMTAFVDAASTSGLPEIDEHGRYKVYFPQDTSGLGGGKASCWIRRMQPHVGKGQGTVFPLSPGAEVMISFLDGDPDRPFIAGAVANSETGSAESANNSLISGFGTDNGNSLIFNNNSKKQGLSLRTGGASGIYMSSGSLDSQITTSNNISSYATAAATSFSGLANSLKGGFSSSLTAMPWTSDEAMTVKTVLGALSSLGNDVFDATKNKKAQTCWDGVNTLLKVINSVYACAKVSPYIDYGANLTATNNKATLGTAVFPEGKAKGWFIAFSVLHMMAMVVNKSAAAAEDWKKAEKKKSDHEAMLRKTFAKIQREKQLEGKSDKEKLEKNLEFIATLKTETQDEILKLYMSDADRLQMFSMNVAQRAALRQKYFKLYPSALDAALKKIDEEAAKKVKVADINSTSMDEVKQRIDKEDKTYFAKLDLPKLDEELKWGKANAINKHVGSAISALTAEITAMITILKRSFKVDSADDMGGVKIVAEDKNVAIASNTETRVTSDKLVTIRALKHQKVRISQNTHKELVDKLKKAGQEIYKDTDKGNLLLTSDHTYSGSFKDTTVLSKDELLLGSEKIKLSNKKADFKLLENDYKIQYPSTSGDYIKKVSETKFSTLEMEQTKVDLRCEDDAKKASMLVQPTKQECKVTDGTDTGSITLEKNALTVQAKAWKLDLTDKGSKSTFSASHEKGLSFALAKSSDKKKATLTADDGITLNARSGKFEVTSKDATLNAKGNVTIKGQKINFANKITIDPSKIGVKAGGQLSLEGGMIKIG